MKKLRYLSLLIGSMLLAACSDETFVEVNPAPYSEGEPALLGGEIVVPNTRAVVSSRSIDGNAESEIYELMLIGFEKTSGRVMHLDLTGKVSSKDLVEATAKRRYVIDTPVPVKTGHYRMYSIANWSSAYGGITTSELLAVTSENELKQMCCKNLGEQIDLVGTNGFPMTGFLENFEINNPNEVNIFPAMHIQRATALIQFEIKTGKSSWAEDCPMSFKPTKCTLYNLPARVCAFNSIDGTVNPTPAEEKLKLLQPVEIPIMGNTFSFYMLETTGNTAKASVDKWINREAWDHQATQGLFEDADFTQRKFNNAPDNAPFVVVEGEYSGPAETASPNEVFEGTVRFVMHLGNFNGNEGGFLDNYNVPRNESHKYTITIKSANSILANVEHNQQNPAIEGSLLASSKIELDAHFNKVMMMIPKGRLTSDSATLTISTPNTPYTTVKLSELNTSNELDYNWVQFQKPDVAADGSFTFPTYAGINPDKTCMMVNGRKWGHINDLYNNPGEYCQEKEITENGVTQSYYYTAVFIDENIYAGDTRLRPSQWAGNTRSNRMFILNKGQDHPSDDGMSRYAKSSSFHIEQKPVATPYSIDNYATSSYNPFGLEWLAETTVNADYKPSGITNPIGYEASLRLDTENMPTTDPTDLNDNNGHEMTWYWWGSKNGGITDVNAIWWPQSDGTYKLDNTAVTTVSQAIASRNRDENGNGKIDKNELKWYVPTITQYNIMYVAANNMPEQLRLYSIDMRNSNDNADKAFARFFSSSEINRRMYWQDQNAAGAQKQISENWFQPYHRVRFVRNLGATPTSYRNDITRMTVHDKSQRRITVTNPNICRQYYYTGAYAPHRADDPENMVPVVLEYYPKLFKIKNDGDHIGLSGNDYIAKAANLNELTLNGYMKINNLTGLTELPDGWRVPNMTELAILRLNGVIASLYNEAIDNGTLTKRPELGTTYDTGAIYSCTFPTNEYWKANRDIPFYFNGSFFTNNTDAMNADWFDRTTMVLVRDVRQSNDYDGDSGFSNGGSVIK